MAAAASAEATGSVERAIDLLFHLHIQPGPVGVTAVGRALGMPKSSVHRLLTALGRRGLVERDARGRWRPGVALVALGLGALEAEPLVAAARPVLETAAAELGETFFVTAARAGRIVVLDKVEGTGFLRAAPRVGSTVPVHATAVGKLQLAFDPGRVERGALDPFTQHTLRDDEALAHEVARVRARGFAENRDEWIPGLSVVAAAVRSGGVLHGAVALALPSARLPQLVGADLPGRVCQAAARVAARLAGRTTA